MHEDMDTRQGFADHVKAVRRFTNTAPPGRRFGRARPRRKLVDAVRRVSSSPTRRFQRQQ
jgi:hypothetical protein